MLILFFQQQIALNNHNDYFHYEWCTLHCLVVCKNLQPLWLQQPFLLNNSIYLSVTMFTNLIRNKRTWIYQSQKRHMNSCIKPEYFHCSLIKINMLCPYIAENPTPKMTFLFEDWIKPLVKFEITDSISFYVSELWRYTFLLSLHKSMKDSLANLSSILRNKPILL